MLECFRTFQKHYPESKNCSRSEKHAMPDFVESIHKASPYHYKINLSRRDVYRERRKVGFPRWPLDVTLLG